MSVPKAKNIWLFFKVKKKFFFLGLASAYLVATLHFVFLWTFEKTYLNPDWVLQSVMKAKVLEQGRDLVVDRILDQIFHGEIKRWLPSDEWEILIREDAHQWSKELMNAHQLKKTTQLFMQKILDYLKGHAQRVQCHFDFRPLIMNASQNLMRYLYRSKLIRHGYHAVIQYMAWKLSQKTSQWPSGFEIKAQDLEELFVGLFPRTWLIDQLAERIHLILPTLLDPSKALHISIPLHERQYDMLIVPLGNFFQKANVRRFIEAYLIRPAVQKTLLNRFPLPWQWHFEEEDMVHALEWALGEPWIREQYRRIVGEIIAYLFGKKKTFSIEISFEDGREIGIQWLTALMVEKLQHQMSQLPPCPTPKAFWKELREINNPLKCRLTGIQAHGSMFMVKAQFRLHLNRILEGRFPKKWTINRKVLIQIGAHAVVYWMDLLKEISQKGLVFDDREWRAWIKDEYLQTLDKVLELLHRGWDCFAHPDSPWKNLLQKLRQKILFWQKVMRFSLGIALLTWLLFMFLWELPQWKILGVLAMITGVITISISPKMAQYIFDLGMIWIQRLPHSSLDWALTCAWKDMAQGFKTQLNAWGQGLILAGLVWFFLIWFSSRFFWGNDHTNFG